ncbi:MAG: MFS transporter [Acidimicrobiales bacterium]|nr:MFS transporter [Acidimicrobiales bacterium]
MGAATSTTETAPGWVRSLADVARGRSDLDKLLRLHPLHSAGEAFFAVSLAGSLFFNVSVDAARPRILLYLALTMAPFVVLAPLIGPLIDRVRGGPRIVMSATLVGRAVLAVMLASQLRTLLLFPLAFGILVLARTYAVSRIALVPVLVSDRGRLVAANARLARIGTVGGLVGSGIAVAILAAADAQWVLRGAVVVYGVAGLTALRLPLTTSPDAEAPVEEYLELHDPVIQATTLDMAALRAAVGFLMFHLGFVLKTDGAPTWFFGLVAGLSAVGGFAGNIFAPGLRRRYREQAMLTISLTAPALAILVASLRLHEITIVVAVVVLGVAAAVARRAYDSVVQTRAPHAKRGQAYAWLETRLELAWVAGALVAVMARASGWLGMLGLAAGMGAVAALHARRTRTWVALREVRRTDPLAVRLLRTAEQLAAQGDVEQAVVAAVAAAEIASGAAADEDVAGPVRDLRDMRASVLAGAISVPQEQALAMARQVVEPVEVSP